MRGRGDQTVGTERASKYRAGHLITERVLLHACNRLTGSPPSLLGLYMHSMAQARHVGLTGHPVGQLDFCWTTVCWDVVLCLQVLHFLFAILEVRSKRSFDCGCSFYCNEVCKRPKTCSSTQSFTMKY